MLIEGVYERLYNPPTFSDQLTTVTLELRNKIIMIASIFTNSLYLINRLEIITELIAIVSNCFMVLDSSVVFQNKFALAHVKHNFVVTSRLLQDLD